MSDKRRIGSEQAATRARILDATRDLMIQSGYAAASVRKVAAHAGLKPALVQYYFPTMDDLFIALYRREAERSIERQAEAMASERPLHALWDLSNNAAQNELAIEFMALANHRKQIQAEIASYNESARKLQAVALPDLLRKAAIDLEEFPPAGVSLLLAGVARALVMEQGLGIAGGHQDARAIVQNWLDAVEPPKRG